MENYLQKLFIDDVKGALGRYDGSSEGDAPSAPSAPTGPTDNRTSLAYWYQYLADQAYEVFEPDFETTWETYGQMKTIEELEYPSGTGNATTVKGGWSNTEGGYANIFSIAVCEPLNGYYETHRLSVRKFVGTLDLSGVTDLSGLFKGVYTLQDAGTIIVSEKATNYTDMFYNRYELGHVIFKGVIAGDGLSVTSTNLDRDSLLSILNCLKDFSTDTLPHLVRFGSSNLSSLTEEEIAIAGEKGWDLQ